MILKKRSDHVTDIDMLFLKTLKVISQEKQIGVEKLLLKYNIKKSSERFS